MNEDKGNQKFYDGMYLCRVPHGQELELGKYEYWNGTVFQKERISPTKETAVLGPGSTGGMVTWNPYLGKYLYIYTSKCSPSPPPSLLFSSAFANSGPNNLQHTT